MYAQGSVANMLRSLFVIGLIMSVFVLVFPRAEPLAPDVDVQETARQLESSQHLGISAPVDLPETWVPVRAQYQRMGDAKMTWVVGYTTPEGEYAALQQTADPSDEWVNTQVNRGDRTGEVEIDGVTWQRYERPGSTPQRSLVDRPEDGSLATVLTGSSSFAELEALLRSLEPVPTQ